MTTAYTDGEIRRQLRLGEDSAWEFTSVVFHNNDPVRRQREGWADKIAAFANARGGVLLLGVTDAGDVPGMSREQLDVLERQVNRTLADEFLYNFRFRSESERRIRLRRWVHDCNCHRHHTAAGGPPASRANNLTRTDT